MKRLSLLLILGLFLAGSVQAQWATQAVKFARGGMAVMELSAPDANNIWAIGIDTSFSQFNVDYSRSTNGGTTWAKGSLGSVMFFHQITSIAAVDGNTAWATVLDLTSMKGKIFKTTNGGTSWTQQGANTFAAPDGSPVSIRFFDANNGVAIGDPNGGAFDIYTTSNGGTTWTRVPATNLPAALPNEYTSGPAAVSGNNIWFVTDSGRIFKSSNKGVNWSVYSSTKADAYNITFRDAQNGLMIADGELVRTTNGGQTWTVVPYSGPFHFGGLSAVPGKNGTYVSTGAFSGDEGSSYTTDNGQTWTALESTKLHTVVLFVSATTGWSGGVTGSATAGGINKFTGSLGTTTATSELLSAGQLTVYPNPGNGYFNISTSGIPAANLQLSIRNVTGQEVFTQVLATGQNETLTADLSQQPKGIYLLTVVAGEQVFTQKLIVE